MSSDAPAAPTAPGVPGLPAATPALAPEGFRPLPAGGEFIRMVGPLYIKHAADGSRMGFRVEPRHTNPMGIAHGGMVASFCDMLLPMLAHRQSTTLERRFLPTISLQVDYLAPSPLGAWIEGTAQLLRQTHSLVFMQGLVTADGVPVARASGVFKIGPTWPAGLAAGLDAALGAG